MNNLLEVKKLSKHFGGIKAVEQCSFVVEQGKITALIGPNGAGKSTVFNLISGLYAPDSGRLIFDQHDITGYSIEQIANLGVSRLLQHSRLFKNLTVKENLLMALDNEDTCFWKNLFGFKFERKEETLREILKQLGLEDTIDRRAEELSYGQKKLIDLVRSVLHPHKLLLLDEPVAGIHPNLRQIVLNFLLQIKSHGETVLLVEHDMAFTMEVADSILLMSAGRVIAQGTPESVQSSSLFVDAYLGNMRNTVSQKEVA